MSTDTAPVPSSGPCAGRRVPATRTRSPDTHSSRGKAHTAREQTDTQAPGGSTSEIFRAGQSAETETDQWCQGSAGAATAEDTRDLFGERPTFHSGSGGGGVTQCIYKTH